MSKLFGKEIVEVVMPTTGGAPLTIGSFIDYRLPIEGIDDLKEGDRLFVKINGKLFSATVISLESVE